MPKVKNSKSATKRVVKITSKGKILLKRMSAQHRTGGKSKRCLNDSTKNFEISKANLKTIKKLIPYR